MEQEQNTQTKEVSGYNSGPTGKTLSLPAQLVRFLDSFPGLWAFAVLFIAWSALFNFFGNATFGYVPTASLFVWMYNAYTSSSSDDGHGLLIPFVVLALCWWKREQLISAEKRPSWLGFWLVSFAGLLHIVGYLFQQPRISIIAYFTGLYGLIVAVWGLEFGKRIAFPYVLFIFMVPLAAVTEWITVPMRRAASIVAAFVARTVLGVPLVREGAQLFDPQGKYSYEVAAACSGIRSLITVTAISVVFSALYIKSVWRRIVFVLSALPITFAANILRVLTIIIVARVYGERAGMIVHEWFGFVTFLLALGVLFALERLIGDQQSSLTSRTRQ